MAKWPFNGGAMDQAARDGGGLGVKSGGQPVKKMMPYCAPKTTSGKQVDTSPKGTSHGCCGTQGKH
jgi:hypothetical protein